jgi:hypothetical protein
VRPRDEGRGFCKKTWKAEGGGRQVCANSFHLSSWPFDLDLAVLIGVCIVWTCGLFPLDTFPFTPSVS